MTLFASDLSLFIGQEVSIRGDVYELLAVYEKSSAVVPTDIHLGYDSPVSNELIKPICRMMEDMTETEQADWQERYEFIDVDISTNWDEIKYLTSKGICPFPEWEKEGLVIIKER